MEIKYIPSCCKPRKDKETGQEIEAKYSGSVLLDVPDFVELGKMQMESGAIDMADLHEEGKRINTKIGWGSMLKMAELVKPYIKAADITFVPTKEKISIGSNAELEKLYKNPKFQPVIMDIAGFYLGGMQSEGN